MRTIRCLRALASRFPSMLEKACIWIVESLADETLCGADGEPIAVRRGGVWRIV